MLSNQTAEKTCLLIPAYQPSGELITLVKDLSQAGFEHILVIDDGSGKAYQSLFEKLKTDYPITFLQHKENQGKGGAIKTGLQYAKDHLQDQIKGVVTLDADGQHVLEDIVKVADALQTSPSQLVLGERYFGDDVPARSKFGNLLTRTLFAWIYRTKLEDTQTGLRGIPVAMFQDFLDIPYNGYEYELECLICAAKHPAGIRKVSIKTIYIDDNASSHFNPIIDSIKIYYVFFRYLVIAILSFLIDLTIYAPLAYMTHSVLFSLLPARLISGTFNFYFNKYHVYRERERARLRAEIAAYIALAIFVFLMSYTLISVFHAYFGLGIIFAKVLVDAMLFLGSFIIQRLVIFRRS